LFLTQSFGSTAFFAVATLASIAGAELSGTRGMAGAPSAAYLFGTAGAAFLWGNLMDVIGRRGALLGGIALGVAGAMLAAWGAAAQAFVAFLAGMFLIGIANAAITLGRFVAGEVVRSAHRGRAIS
jgi:MFS family permease